jgi:hypothetical protein
MTKKFYLKLLFVWAVSVRGSLRIPHTDTSSGTPGLTRVTEQPNQKVAKKLLLDEG